MQPKDTLEVSSCNFDPGLARPLRSWQIAPKIPHDGPGIWSPRVGVGARWLTSSIFVPIWIVTVLVGPGWAISAPTAIPAVAPGGSCTAASAVATFLKPMARHCMVSASRPRCLCGQWTCWRKGWVFRRGPRVRGRSRYRASLVDGGGEPCGGLFAVLLSRRVRYPSAVR